MNCPDPAPPQPTPAPPRVLLTEPEAARMLRCCTKHVYNLFKRGELPRVKVGASVRYAPSDLLAYIERSTGVNRG